MISIIIPIYNEEENIPELLKKIEQASAEWGEHEVIFVDDGGHDKSLRLLKEASRQKMNYKVISFSRNFGHQTAVTAGLEAAQGDAVVIIDGDLQDPPEIIDKFIAKWKEGFPIVYGIRQNRKENFFKRMAYKSFYRLLKYLTEFDVPLDSGDFSLIDRKIVDMINQLPERNRFVRGLRSWTGYESVGVAYERDARFAGQPKFTLRKLMRLALDGIVGFSTVPLKLATYLGFFISLISFIGVIIMLVQKLFVGIPLQGWTSLILTIVFMGGIQLLILGVIGEYLSRIYIESQRRPLYIIKEKYGFSE